MKIRKSFLMGAWVLCMYIYSTRVYIPRWTKYNRRNKCEHVKRLCCAVKFRWNLNWLSRKKNSVLEPESCKPSHKISFYDFTFDRKRIQAEISSGKRGWKSMKHFFFLDHKNACTRCNNVIMENNNHFARAWYHSNRIINAWRIPSGQRCCSVMINARNTDARVVFVGFFFSFPEMITCDTLKRRVLFKYLQETNLLKCSFAMTREFIQNILIQLQIFFFSFFSIATTIQWQIAF